MRLLFASLLFLTSQQLSANTVDELRVQAQNNDLAYKVVESLTVEVGPRIAGSIGDKKAVAWAEQKLHQLGFDKVYKQPVRVRNWSRGIAQAQIVAPYPQSLAITALGGSVATPEQGLEAMLVMFESLEALKQATPARVKNKIVFINKKMQRERSGRFYGATVSGRSQGAIEAAKLGANAIIIRSVGTDNSRFPHTGAMRYHDEVKKIPAGAISNADADLLETMINQHQDVALSLKMQAKEHGWQTSYNVIGEITGNKYPDEVVMLAAHLDSWDEGTGALDDGAGVGIVSAAASLVKQIMGQPQRTIRVVLYANEEFGLVGAKEYVKKNKQDLANIIVAAESDFGAGKIWQLDTRFANQTLPYVDKIIQELQPLGIAKGNNTARGGPDISMFPKYGVPVASLRQDGTYYFDFHHTANDTLDKIDPEAIAQNQAAYAIFAYMMANTRIDPRQAQ